MKNKKSLGQHWLKNRIILEEIADEAAGVAEGFGMFEDAGAVRADRERLANQNTSQKEKEMQEKTSYRAKVCLEIGPGLGTLTSSLLRRFEEVVAVEFDPDLAHNLPKSFPGKNLKVVNEDILKFDFEALKEPYVVAGNIPYYITSPIIEKLITLENRPVRIVLLIQKEVAERILSDKSSVLSLMVENRARVLPGILVPRAEFTPPPKVDSATIILEPHPPLVSDAVFRLIYAGFKSPRKKLVHNLAGFAQKEVLLSLFDKLGISPDARPADLGLLKWRELFDGLALKTDNLTK